MDVKIGVLFIVAILVIALGILTIILNLKPKKKSIDYRALFFIGIVWLLAGIVMNSNLFSAIGLAFSLISLLRYGKWQSNKKNWSKLSNQERKLVKVSMIILGILVVVGIVVLYLVYKGIIY